MNILNKMINTNVKKLKREIESKEKKQESTPVFKEKQESTPVFK